MLLGRGHTLKREHNSPSHKTLRACELVCVMRRAGRAGDKTGTSYGFTTGSHVVAIMAGREMGSIVSLKNRRNWERTPNMHAISKAGMQVQTSTQAHTHLN